MNGKITVLALFGLMAATNSALASSDKNCGNADQSTWMSKDAVMQKARDLGYKPAKVKIEDGCYEVYATKDGARFEVFLNPVSGDLVRVKYK